MPNYAIRVELRGYPTAEEYQRLHVLMASMGFPNTIRGASGNGEIRNFSLPRAVYFGFSVNDCATVRNQVVAAVKTNIQTDIIVFVVESVNWAMGW